ncbi:LuxR C-terminal-related transcriptional regulator [Streptomyces sp. NPDC005808]|uniref:LuxR C-terminal-related transcriptional regulator n=1 Tax=Streptomyces sp. NPDC005808 TaxID=3364734 RepID=UPI0036C0C803
MGFGFGFGQRRGGHLPVELTSFVGRTEELALARGALERARLVTLVGPGGVGKSRTALRVAAGVGERFPDGVWLAELSELRDPELIPATLAAVLELPEQSGMKPLDAVVAHLQGRRLLIVLDTCEHLIDGCATLSEILLREAGGVSILATSRQPLDVPGEHCLQIAPLAHDDALELFVQRARAVVPGFAVVDGDQEQLAALVDRLDGIPLALELAAVRLRAVPLAELVARLDRRFEVLTGGRRTALTRHQTLRTAIGWSHELCTPEERTLWARLSVFAGSFELAAAEQVCAGGELQAGGVLEPLIGLVDKSVVQRVGQAGGRYRLLDTLREYGADRLEESGGGAAVRERHFAYLRDLGVRFEDGFFTPRQTELHHEVRAGIADLRAALEYAYGSGVPGTAAEGLWLAARLWPHWRARGALSEGRYWIEKGLERVPGDCPARAWGLLVTGMFGVWNSDLALALERTRQADEVAARIGAETETVGPIARGYIGGLRALCGEVSYEEGLAMVEAERRVLLARDDLLGIALHHYEGALVRAVLGDVPGALELCEVGLARLEETGERQMHASTLGAYGLISWLAGDRTESPARLRQAFEEVAGIGEVLVAGLCCLGLSWSAAYEKRYVRAAWLLGYAENAQRLHSAPIGLLPSVLQEQESVRRKIRGALGGPQFERWRLVGARLSGPEVLEAVRGDVDTPGSVPGPRGGVRRGGADALTRREREVAALVAQGLSNREIAERLVISKRTADAHVEHILAKLGVGSRGEIPAVPDA